MKNLLITIALMLGFAVSAQAQTYVDFVGGQIGADGVMGERAEDDGTLLQYGSVYIKFSATSTDGEGYAYFDKGNAGLGVCGNTNLTSQCVPSSDDNLTLGETLSISFFSDALGKNALNTTIDSLTFRDANHKTVLITDSSNFLFGVDNALDINGVPLGMTSTSMLGFGPSAEGQQFNFGFGNTEYYISGMMVSGIPEPATWLMMIIGFGIVSASARRSRRSSSIAHTC